MRSNTPDLSIELCDPQEVPQLYISRAYWERQFKLLNLWPAILSHDRIYQSYSDQIDHFFPEFQLAAVIKAEPRAIVGVAHSVPLQLEEDWPLPETGWDYAMETAFVQRQSNVSPDSLCGISITVLRDFQSKGVGTRLISGLLELAARKQYKSVIMPVRPVSKESVPEMPMAQFLALRRDDGLHKDPWIRAHEKLGGKVLNVCSRSMTVSAKLPELERWARRKFLSSGPYVVKGCLVPIVVDVERKVGLYQEPNVWVVHSLPLKG